MSDPCITTVIVTDTFASETGLRWRVRYREDEVTWLFKDGMEQKGELPNYEPTWLPEGCEVRSDYWGPARDRSIGYKNQMLPMDCCGLTILATLNFSYET